MKIEELKVGDYLYRVYSTWTGDFMSKKLKIVGETKVTWRLEDNVKVYKANLDKYGERYSRDTYQIELTDWQKEKMKTIKTRRKAESSLDKLSKYLKEKGDMPKEILLLIDKL